MHEKRHSLVNGYLCSFSSIFWKRSFGATATKLVVVVVMGPSTISSWDQSSNCLVSVI